MTENLPLKLALLINHMALRKDNRFGNKDLVQSLMHH